MCDKGSRYNLEVEEYKVCQEVDWLIGEYTPEQSSASYSVSGGVVGENVAAAVMTHIVKGNKEFKDKLPRVCQNREK